MDGLGERDAEVDKEAAEAHGQLEGDLDVGVLLLLLDGGGGAAEPHGGQGAAAGQPEAAQGKAGLDGEVEVGDLLVVGEVAQAHAGAEAEILAKPVGVAHVEAEAQTGLVFPRHVAVEGHGADAEALEGYRQFILGTFLLGLQVRHSKKDKG